MHDGTRLFWPTEGTLLQATQTKYVSADRLISKTDKEKAVADVGRKRQQQKPTQIPFGNDKQGQKQIPFGNDKQGQKQIPFGNDKQGQKQIPFGNDKQKTR